MRVTLERLPGVESADVRLNEGRAIVRLAPGNAITMADIRRIVTRNGFTPQQAVVDAQADVVAAGARLQLRISGTNDVYDVAAQPEAVQQQLKNSDGHRVLIGGVVPPQNNPRARPVVQVTRVTPATR